MTKRRSDLQKYVADRKQRDKSFANGYKSGFKRFRKKTLCEDAERLYWDKTDSADVIDWKKAKFARFPNLKPSMKLISIRLPEILIDEIKVIANKQDVPYQSLMKVYLADRIKKEYNHLKVRRVK